MENFTFTRPETGFMVTDLENKIVEIFLQLNEEFGGANNTNEVLFKMFELSFPNATEQELKEFTKLQGAFRAINSMIAENQEAMDCLIEEQKHL
ncbi:MAG: hypothetical protein CSA38_02055 [Flavobacteriales bacterium]|nr:MAG: hypothetical protein CSA38_02055 [Flavobacteriales bacterium]